jgi:hypothetical protein
MSCVRLLVSIPVTMWLLSIKHAADGIREHTAYWFCLINNPLTKVKQSHVSGHHY